MSYGRYPYGGSNPSYGYGSYDRNPGHRANYGGYYRPSIYNEYSYGRRRRRPNFWNRDRYTMNRWRRYRRRERRRDSPPSRENSPEPTPRPLPPKEEIVSQLLVKDIDLNIQENAAKHMTDDYECTSRGRDNNEPPELVVRRGNVMKLKISFDQRYNKKKHDLKLGFSIGEKPNRDEKTMVVLDVDEDGRRKYPPNEWGAYLESRHENDIEVNVSIAANCIVGEWNITVMTFSEASDGRSKPLMFTYKHDEDVVILFNPWCRDDTVHMESNTLLDEYILNEGGCVFVGTASKFKARPWYFGQFDDGILDVSLHLLRLGSKDGKITEMHNPVEVSRLIVKMINSNDDNGVLVGKWNGEYADGKSPTSWTGSPKILQQFMDSGSVRYGQCWVFSCLTTTVCRCLGLPCRTVTNFNSAHDTDADNLITKYVEEKGGKMTNHSYTTDSVWNFHVWNEVWMTRPDLHEKGFDGWQVIDATPQEMSFGAFTCGPCPKAAVKEGRVDVLYDAGFVFSEVNADVATILMRGNKIEEFLGLEKDKIGKKVSTKTPDGKPYITIPSTVSDYARKEHDDKYTLDITREYKYPEGTGKERRAVEMAYKLAKNYKPTRDPYNTEPVTEAVSIKFYHSDEVMIGSDFKLDVIIKNAGPREREIKNLSLTIASKSYSGHIYPAFVRRPAESFSLGGRQETTYTVLVSALEYVPHLVEQGSLHIEVYGSVSPLPGYGNSHKKIFQSHEFSFVLPNLDVEGPESGAIGRPVTFRVSFKNPLPTPLTNCMMAMGGAGFKNADDERLPDVRAGETFVGTFTMTPKREKKQPEVVFEFECDQLKDIDGSTSITISN